MGLVDLAKQVVAGRNEKASVAWKIEDKAAKRCIGAQTATQHAAQPTFPERNHFEPAMVEQPIHGIQAGP